MIATGISFSADGKRIKMWEVKVPIGESPREAIEDSCEGECLGSVHLGDLVFHVKQNPPPDGVEPNKIQRDDWRKVLKEYGCL